LGWQKAKGVCVALMEDGGGVTRVEGEVASHHSCKRRERASNVVIYVSSTNNNISGSDRLPDK